MEKSQNCRFAFWIAKISNSGFENLDFGENITGCTVNYTFSGQTYEMIPGSTPGHYIATIGDLPVGEDQNIYINVYRDEPYYYFAPVIIHLTVDDPPPEDYSLIIGVLSVSIVGLVGG